MIGNLEPEENVMKEKFPSADMLGQLAIALGKMDWSPDDKLIVKIGGTQVSGIDVGENYNEKWQSPIGTRKYNKDAFIVIENVTRNPVVPSQPNPELKQAHPYEKK
jgi:predicted butyrate kinase (DUF1464 family)